jgi:hypothetical protein
VINVLKEELPVLKDVKKFVPSAPDTLVDIFLNQGNSNPDVVTFLNFISVINSIPVSPGNANSTIGFGSFNFTSNGTPYDIFKNALDSAPINNVISQLSFSGDSTDQDFLKQLEGAPSTDPQNSGLGLNLDFPVFDDPSRLFGILLGQDVPLMNCHLTYDDSPAAFSKFYPVLGPLGIQLNGSFTFHTDLDLGFDTEFLVKNPTDVASAFYVRTASITLAASLAAGPGVNLVAVSVSVQGGINGTATLSLRPPVNNGEYQDGLVRPRDFPVDESAYGPLGIFVVNGEIDADLEIHIQVGLNTPFGNIGPQFDLVLASTKILDFNGGNTPLNNQPILAGAGHAKQTGATPDGIPIFDLSEPSNYILSQGPGELILNMGPYASLRKNGDLTDGNEDFRVNHISGAPTAPGGETVAVSAFGIEQEYSGVTSIWAEGGLGSNTIIIDRDVLAPATLFATVDDNPTNPLIPPNPNYGMFDPVKYSIFTNADFLSTHNVLKAGGGNALLVGGQGVASELAYPLLDLFANPPVTWVHGGDELLGGLANTTLIGGNSELGWQNAETLVGGTDPTSKNTIIAGDGGVDTLLAGPNGDSLRGGTSGTDHFIAGAGNDFMVGGGGANDYSWQEGDGNTNVIGGTGAGATNTLDITVNTPGASFSIGRGGSSPLQVNMTIPASGGGMPVLRTIKGRNIAALGADDTGDAATYNVFDQVGTGVSQIVVNAHEAGHAGGAGDTVNVMNGLTTTPNIVDISADPNYGDLLNYQNGKITQSSGAVTIANITIKGSAASPVPSGDTVYQVITAVPKLSDTLHVTTGSADDTVSVESTQSGPVAGSQGGDVYVNTEAGDDTINVGTSTPGKGVGLLDRIQGNLYIDAGSGMQNQLNIDEGAATYGDILALTAQIMNKLATYELLRYYGESLPNGEGGGPSSGAEHHRYPLAIGYQVSNQGQFGAGVNLYLTRARDTLYVTDTMLGAPTTVYTDGRGSGPNDQIIVGYNGADPINPGTPAHSTISGIIAPLEIEGTNGPIKNLDLGGVDLKVYDELLPVVEDYTVTSSQLGRSGQTPITYHALGTSANPGTLELWGAEVGNNISVEGTAAWTATTVNAGNGNNTILVGQPIRLIIPPNINILLGYSLDAIQGLLTVNGGVGKNQMTVDDDFSPSHAYDLTASSLQRTGGIVVAPISFSKLTALTLKEAAGPDTATTVSGTSLGTSVLVVPGSGHDSVTLTALDQFKGAITFQWQVGMKNVVVDDSSATQNAQYAINLGATSGTLVHDGATAATFNYQGTPPDPLASLFLFAGLKHVDVINVLGITPGTLTQLFGGTVTNSVTVGDTNPKDPKPDQLDVVQGTLIVDGMGTTEVLIYDQLGPSRRPYVLGAASLQFSPSLPAIQFAKVSSLILDAAPAAIVGVAGVESGTTAQLNLSGTGSLVTVGYGTGRLLGFINGTVVVHGTGTDLVDIDDHNGPGMSVYHLTADSVSDSTAMIQYNHVHSVLLRGAHGPSQYFVDSVSASPIVTIAAQGVGNLLRGPIQDTVWTITTLNGGTLGPLRFSGIQNLTGGTGLNVFVFDAGASVSGRIDGGPGGDNWLDYAAYAAPVTVNLQTNFATGAGGGIAEIRNMRGGQSGNTLTGNGLGNILIGGAGSLTITGGTGRSILIADMGAGVIKGGSGTDILIGAKTSYDLSLLANDKALDDILAEWQSGNPYLTRISNIKNGLGLTGGNKLRWGFEVKDNGVPDLLSAIPTPDPPVSNQVGDWFLTATSAAIKNKESYEVIN